MKRRNFIAQTFVAGAAAGLTVTPLFAAQSEARPTQGENAFKLKYAPHLGMFPELAGNDPIDVIRFCHEQGFRAVFDNGLMDKSPEDQEKIANELARLNMDLGPFVLYADFSKETMVLDDKEVRKMLANKVRKGLEVRKRTGAKWALMVPGRYNQQMDWDYQTANVIDCMREMSDIAGKGDLTLVLEPLNKRDHPGLFLTGIPQAYMICQAVNHLYCKIVDDLYHQQITEGNLIPNIDAAWTQIGAFHLGDNPGRKEPTSGEINFRNIFKHLYEKGYDGTLCMEHGKSRPGKEGELALINAYRECDTF